MSTLEDLWRGADPPPDPPPDLPANLHDTWRAAQHYLAQGRGKYERPTQWPLERKKANWATLVSSAGTKLDSASEKHPWHDPACERLEILADHLVDSGHDRDFVHEMVTHLQEAATTPGLKRLADSRWQHWVRFLIGHRPTSLRLGTSLSGTTHLPPPGKLVLHEEFLALLSVCLRDGRARAIRDAAMFVCIYGAATSTNELGYLELSDWTPDPPSLRLKSGRDPFKHRTVALGYEAANLLAGWVAMRGRRPGRMFYSLDRFGALRSERITNATIHAALRQRCKQAALSLVTPEELRRAGLTRLVEHGADAYVVADIAGHARLLETDAHEPPCSIVRAPLASHAETPFHKW